MKVGLAFALTFGLVQAAPPVPSFDHAVVELLPGGDRHTVLSDDLDGDGLRELILSGGRDVSIFFLADGALPTRPDIIVRLPDDVVFIDVADTDGDDARELVCMTPTGVRTIRFDGRVAEAPREVPGLSRDDIALQPVPAADVGWNDILFEIDGRPGEDAVLPTRDGYRVFLRHAGEFVDGGLLPAVPTGAISLSTGSDLGFVEQTVVMPRIYVGDIDGDGTREVLTFDGRAVRAYSPPREGEDVWRSRLRKTLYSDEASLPEALLQSRNVRVEDLDATGRAVLMVVRSLEGELDFFGGDDPLSERRSLRFDGWLLPPKLVDIDGDGRLDLLAPTVEAIDMLTLTKVFLSRSFRMRYSIFNNREDVRYRRRPDEVRELVLPLEYQTSGGELEVENQMVYSFEGDFDGDGRKDFLMRRAPTELVVYRGDETGFEAEPSATWEVDDSSDFLTIRPRLCDLNADGKSDLLLLYDARDGGTDRYIFRLSR